MNLLVSRRHRPSPSKKYLLPLVWWRGVGNSRYAAVSLVRSLKYRSALNMSEYWMPRKFCACCKCWFADNKASIQFHEQGKRHKENAAKRIKEIQKKGIKDFKKQQKLEDDMAKIERAAIAAYKKDLQNNAEAITTSVIPELPQPTYSFIEVPVKKEKPVYQQESQWEPPAEGFVSVEEQAEQNTETTIEVTIKVEEEVPDVKPDILTIKKEKEEEEEEQEAIINPPRNIGPQPKHDPYGQWVTVEKVEPVQIDFQLPKPSEDYVEVVIPVAKAEPRLKFKEKIISYIGDEDDSTEVTFKKRKFTGSSKRNTRQRTNDDV